MGTKIINYLFGKPKTLFLIDSLGAMLSAFFLFVVLRNFQEYIGMPKTILTYLAAIATCFWVYSTVCFFFLKENWTPFIWVIGIANLLYCVLTIGLLIIHLPHLTKIGITYFTIEIALIFSLLYIELNVAVLIQKSGQKLQSTRNWITHKE